MQEQAANRAVTIPSRMERRMVAIISRLARSWKDGQMFTLLEDLIRTTPRGVGDLLSWSMWPRLQATHLDDRCTLIHSTAEHWALRRMSCGRYKNELMEKSFAQDRSGVALGRCSHSNRGGGRFRNPGPLSRRRYGTGFPSLPEEGPDGGRQAVQGVLSIPVCRQAQRKRNHLQLPRG